MTASRTHPGPGIALTRLTLARRVDDEYVHGIALSARRQLLHLLRSRGQIMLPAPILVVPQHCARSLTRDNLRPASPPLDNQRGTRAGHDLFSVRAS